jgi:hypothetical protein
VFYFITAITKYNLKDDHLSILGLRKKTVFNQDQEKELTEYVLAIEARFFGLKLTEVRGLVYDLAEKNKLSHNFNKVTKMDCKDWLYAFPKRRPELRLRSAELTSLARTMEFNRTIVKQFFCLLSSLYDKYNFTPNNIYNVDETGIPTVPSKQIKVLGLRGKR